MSMLTIDKYYNNRRLINPKNKEAYYVYQSDYEKEITELKELLYNSSILIKEYESSSTRDIVATPFDLKDHQKWLEIHCEEKDNKIAKLTEECDHFKKKNEEKSRSIQSLLRHGRVEGWKMAQQQLNPQYDTEDTLYFIKDLFNDWKKEKQSVKDLFDEQEGDDWYYDIESDEIKNYEDEEDSEEDSE